MDQSFNVSRRRGGEVVGIMHTFRAAVAVLILHYVLYSLKVGAGVLEVMGDILTAHSIFP